MKTAVLIPCRNEATTIGQVVAAFRAALPLAEIYVYDNNSTRRHRRGRARRRRRAAFRADAGQGQRGQTDVRRHRGGRLRAGRRRRDLSPAQRRRNGAPTRQRASRHGGRQKKRRGAGRRLSSRPRVRQPPADAGGRLDLWRQFRGHAVRLPRAIASFRQIIPGAGDRLRDRDRTDGARLSLRLPVAEVETPYFVRPHGSASKLQTYRDGSRISRQS